MTNYDKRNKIMISGYYGYGNIGDEAILTAIVDSIREKKNDTDFTVLSSNPELTSKALNVHSINRMNIFKIISELSSTDLFISGGGGLMQDVTGMASISYYSGLLKLAQILNVPTMVFAQGIGPIKREINKQIVKNVFSNVSAITVREEFSKKDLMGMGIKENKIQVTADPALLLETADKKSVRNILISLGLDPDVPIMGIVIRPWYSWYERQLKAFTSVLYQLANKYGLQILLIPFQLSSDLWLSIEAGTCFSARPESKTRVSVLDKEYSPKEMMGIISSLHLVIGMRLHALIMAAAHHVPSLGIAYDPKVSNFCSLAGFPCISSVAELQNIENFLITVEDIIANIDDYKIKLAERVPGLKELSLNNVNTALSFLK